MKKLVFGSFLFISCFTCAQEESEYQPPLTSWGDPDLQGIYSSATITPFERPAELGDKEFFTPEEAAEFEASYGTNYQDLGETGTYNEFWYDVGTRLVPTLRTSLIIDPPDGRLPSITESARQKLSDRNQILASRSTDGPEFRPLPERCLFWASTGPPIIPTFYNNNYRFVQSPDYVVIHAEMIHDARIIPISQNEHIPRAITQWVGDSRGHWDGNTLVVESTNFTEKSKLELGPAGIRSIRGVGSNIRVTERFTPVSENRIMYRFTVNDPETFTSPWTAEFALNAGAGPVYEYACHEGNYAMRNVLMGARREERETGQ